VTDALIVSVAEVSGTVRSFGQIRASAQDQAVSNLD